MRVVENPSYKHSDEEITAFRKYSEHIYQKDHTQYPPDLLEKLFFLLTEIKKFGIKKDKSLWLTKQLWHKKLSKNEISNRYIPAVLSIMVGERLNSEDAEDDEYLKEHFNIDGKTIEEVEKLGEHHEVKIDDLGIIYEDDEWYVSRPSSFNAVIFVSIGTHWCIGNSDFWANFYLNYLIDNKDIFIFVKKNGKPWKNKAHKMTLGYENQRRDFYDQQMNKYADDSDADAEDIDYTIDEEDSGKFDKIVKIMDEAVNKRNPMIDEFYKAAQNIDKYNALSKKYQDSQYSDIAETKFLSLILSTGNVGPEVMKEILKSTNQSEDAYTILGLASNYKPQTREVIFEELHQYFLPMLRSNDLSLEFYTDESYYGTGKDNGPEYYSLLNNSLKFHVPDKTFFTKKMILFYVEEMFPNIVEELMDHNFADKPEQITKSQVIKMFRKWRRF